MPLTPLATDKFLKVGLPGTATTLSAPGYTIGNNSVNIGSTSNWSTDTPVVFAMDTVTVTNGVAVRNPGSYCEFFGIVSSATAVGNLALLFGTAQNYVAGSLTRVYIPVAGTRENMIIDGLRQDHNGKGNHQSLTDDNNNIWLGRLLVASAVNYLAVSNAIAGASPSLAAAGADTNIDTDYNGKGTGVAHVDGASYQKAQALGSAYVESGCVITFTASTLNWAMTAGVVVVNGKRYYVNSATGSVTASKDVYFDVLVGASRAAASQTLVTTGGNVVANNAASPALAANSIRLGIVVSGASISSVNQGALTAVAPVVSSRTLLISDSLGNMIYNTQPFPKILSAAMITTSYNNVATAGLDTNMAGLLAPVIVPNGVRNLEVVIFNPSVFNTTGPSDAWTVIYDGIAGSGGTHLTEAHSVSGTAGFPYAHTPIIPVSVTPGTTKTYTGALRGAGAGQTVTASASATTPIILLVKAG